MYGLQTPVMNIVWPFVTLNFALMSLARKLYDTRMLLQIVHENSSHIF